MERGFFENARHFLEGGGDVGDVQRLRQEAVVIVSDESFHLGAKRFAARARLVEGLP